MNASVIEYAHKNNVFDPLTYGAAQEQCVFEPQASEFGYERKTTFFSDLSIAEWYGIEDVKDTFKRVVAEWFSNTEYFTEFVLSLNWKSWQWSTLGDMELSQVYIDLYYQARNMVLDKYKGDDLFYFLETTD